MDADWLERYRPIDGGQELGIDVGAGREAVELNRRTIGIRNAIKLKYLVERTAGTA